MSGAFREAPSLKYHLTYPSAEFIRSHAREVFGDEAVAASWLQNPRAIFGGRSPQELLASSDEEQMRDVLKALIAVDYGVYT